jgi:acetyltransferase-like isoleucine patch superfamily enzyme
LSKPLLISAPVRTPLGVNATLRDSIEIGEGCVIGAAAIVMRSTRAHEVYVAPRTKPDERTSDEIGL